VRLTSQQHEDVARSHPVNPVAFDAYLQGYHFFQGSTDKDMDMAAKHFERATQLDPSYALASPWLSRARNWQANEGQVPMEEGRRLRFHRRCNIPGRGTRSSHVSEVYKKLLKQREWRLRWAEKAGTGFTLPGHQQAAAETPSGKSGKILEFRKVG